MNLSLISDQLKNIEILNSYYFNKFNNYKFSIFLKTKVDINSINVFIIIEPFRVEEQYLTITPLWKEYLKRNNPDAKLITMGFVEQENSNYIDLLNLPYNFEVYVNKAFKVTSEWDIPIDGADLKEYIIRFFKGHGSESVKSKLDSLSQIFNTGYYWIQEARDNYSEVINELLIPYGCNEIPDLQKLWNNFFPYFKYLPFFKDIQSIDNIIKELNIFFDSGMDNVKMFKSLYNKLQYSSNKLLEIDQLYIRPELYEEKSDFNN